MKVCIQHTRQIPQDYETIDSSRWAEVPSKSAPTGPRPPDDSHLDNDPGLIFSANVQGVELGGADHYAFEDLNDGSGGISATRWNDQDWDWPEGDKYAEVWTFLPLAPDPKLNGAINTRQSRIFYAQPNKMALLTRDPPAENTEYRPWSEFVLPDPAITRHGAWTTDALKDQHEAVLSFVEWRDWTEGLSLTELDEEGKVKLQRPQGRYDKPEGTITYFLHDTILTNSIHVVERELEMEETDIATPVSILATVPTTSDRFTHVWTTLANSPGESDWPNGAYNCSIDVALAMLIDGYGFLTRGGSAGHFARVNSGLTADEETWTQTETAFIGTGIKTASRTLNPAAGAVGDRFECIIAADNSDTMMAGSLTIRCDDSDSFADGPWVGVGEVTITANLDALLLKTETALANLNSLLLALDQTQTTSLDALLNKLGIIGTASLDALLAVLQTRTSSLDALLTKTDVTVSASLDTLLKALGLTATSNLDSLLLKQGLTVNSSLDSLLTAIDLTVSASLDAVLSKLGITVTTNLDALLLKQGIVSTASLDGLLALGATVTTSLDALLSKLGLTTAASLDSLLILLSIERTSDLDALLLKQGLTVNSSLDSLLTAVGLTTTTSLEGLLTALNVTVTVSLDTLLTKQDVLVTVSLDAILIPAGVTVVTTSLDALLSKLGLSATANLDALLTAIGIPVTTSLDALLKRTDITLSSSLDGLLKATDVTIAASLDSLLKAENITVTGVLDTILAKRMEISASLDSLLSSPDQLTTAALDSLLEKTITLLVSVDGLLQRQGILVTSNIDALLKRLDGTIPGNLDAVLTATVALTSSLDALLQITDRTITVSLDAVLISLIIGPEILGITALVGKSVSTTILIGKI